MKKYKRTPFTVQAVKYEPDCGLEDGFCLWTEVITDGWINSDGLIKKTNANGQIVCPFIKNRRGVIFIREGDYIIYDEGGERHCCGGDKFANRFYEVSEE